jgi:hypothetical protein
MTYVAVDKEGRKMFFHLTLLEDMEMFGVIVTNK